MKKIFAILCVLLMLPIMCFAANPSPTGKTTVSCSPELEFTFADDNELWGNIIKRIEDISDEVKDYVLLEALCITLGQPYEKVEWTLPIEITSEHEPFVLIINSEAIVKQEVPTTENGNIIIDFTDYEPGTYYICFYIKGA